jgi:hypothetical protein
MYILNNLVEEGEEGHIITEDMLTGIEYRDGKMVLIQYTTRLDRTIVACTNNFTVVQNTVDVPMGLSVDDILTMFKTELERAKKKHPDWPGDILHAMVNVSEECGEAVKAANEYVYEDGELDEVVKELVHTGAVTIRALMNL